MKIDIKGIADYEQRLADYMRAKELLKDRESTRDELCSILDRLEKSDSAKILEVSVGQEYKKVHEQLKRIKYGESDDYREYIGVEVSIVTRAITAVTKTRATTSVHAHHGAASASVVLHGILEKETETKVYLSGVHTAISGNKYTKNARGPINKEDIIFLYVESEDDAS